MTTHTISAPVASANRSLPAHDAARLTEGGDQAHIVLGDQTYTLRITRAGKLILTK
jgi:hemin uptake protein HemP